MTLQKGKYRYVQNNACHQLKEQKLRKYMEEGCVRKSLQVDNQEKKTFIVLICLKIEKMELKKPQTKWKRTTTPTGKHHSYDKSTWLWWNWFQCHVGKSPFKINELPLYGTTEIWSVVLYFILSYKLCVMTKTRLEWCSTQRTCTYILHKYTLYLRENDGVSHAC